MIFYTKFWVKITILGYELILSGYFGKNISVFLFLYSQSVISYDFGVFFKIMFSLTV